MLLPGTQEERLAEKVMELARRNEALEDFAAMVAHELKGPLLEVQYGGDPVAAASQALALVDTTLALAIVRTVDTHRAHIMRKLRLETRAELVLFALSNGLIGAS